MEVILVGFFQKQTQKIQVLVIYWRGDSRGIGKRDKEEKTASSLGQLMVSISLTSREAGSQCKTTPQRVAPQDGRHS